jgi:hypothetical protein
MTVTLTTLLAALLMFSSLAMTPATTGAAYPLYAVSLVYAPKSRGA